jgi:hypothetical protein
MTALYPVTTRWSKLPVHHFPGRNCPSPGESRPHVSKIDFIYLAG